MFKNQSGFGHTFNLANCRNFKQPLQDDKMYLITRQAARNLVQNGLKPHLNVLRPLVAAQNRQQIFVQNKSTYKQQKLLRYPAFPLEETLQKFVLSVQPLVTIDELKETECEVQAFRIQDGPKLQALLEEAAKKEDNWLAWRWQRYAYLQYRDPVAIYINPGMTFPLQKFKDEKEWLTYTAKVVYSLVKYKKLIDCNELPIHKMGKLELDNSQFHQVYGTSRIPKLIQDEIDFNPDSKHIAIVCKSHWYSLDIIDDDENPIAPDVIAKELEKIVEKENRRGVSVGILSTDNRDCWAEAYSELIMSPENQMSVQAIQKSLFTLALDDYVDYEEGQELSVLARQLIYGGGSKVNTGNRWMDKTIQMISNPNGMSGFCYEHAPAEGQPIAEIVDYVVKNFKDSKFFESQSSVKNITATPLKMRVTECVQRCIDAASQRIDSLGDNLLLKVLNFQGYGKGFLKEQKISPDSFIQIALQYAFYKMHQVPAAQYETAHLRIFYGGRTETIRSCSNESVTFAKAMLDDKIDNDCRLSLLQKAIKSHKDYCVMALQGRGVDRHLLGLKMMAMENGIPEPKFFSSPGWKKSTYFRVSTSQVASINPVFMAYGPAVDDGYGCCYNPRESDMLFAISAWKSGKDTCAKRFAEAVENALLDMQKLFPSTDKKSKL